MLARSADGKIWVGADEGVASIDPPRLARNEVPLHVLIESARIDGRELAPFEVAVLPSDLSDLEIDYTAPMLSFPERVQFRYRLEGVDPAWRDVGTRRRAYYTDLGPGSYRFRVSASIGDGDWIEAGPPWSFRVLPAWYQTLWFRALVILLIGSVGGLVVSLVQRRRHARAQAELKRQYEITLAERARIAQDLHDTLLQGFAGVTLQLKAAEIALPDQPGVAAETIHRVQRLARESLREARERVWDMHETADGGADLPAALERIARDRTAGMPIEVAVTTEGSLRPLPRSLEDAGFRIGREAIVIWCVTPKPTGWRFTWTIVQGHSASRFGTTGAGSARATRKQRASEDTSGSAEFEIAPCSWGVAARSGRVLAEEPSWLSSCRSPRQESPEHRPDSPL